jgi:hypothetical protein
VVKFTLSVFILNMFVKAAMIYSALTVTVALSAEEESPDDIGISREEDSVSSASQVRLEVDSVYNETMTPISKSLGVTFSSDVEERSYSRDDQLTPYAKMAFSPGLPGLVSPGYNPKGNIMDQC